MSDGTINISKCIQKLEFSIIKYFQFVLLNKHLNRPYSCYLCVKSYFRNYLLTKHLLRKHNISKEEMINLKFSGEILTKKPKGPSPNWMQNIGNLKKPIDSDSSECEESENSDSIMQNSENDDHGEEASDGIFKHN